MVWSGRSLLLVTALAIAGKSALADPPAAAPSTANNVVTAAEASLPTAADVAVDIVSPATSAKAIRDAARLAVPLTRLPAEHQKMVQSVLSDISLFRRMPTVKATLDPRVYQYFLDSPDVAVAIWRVLGISKLELKQTAQGVYEADTGDGSSGTVYMLLRTPTACVVYCEGNFKSPVLPRPIKSKAVVSLNATLTKQADGSTVITHTADMFVNFPSLAVETIARLVSPLSYKYADKNIEEITSFLRMMDISMCRQPGWIEQIAQLMEGVSAEKNNQLLQVAASVYIDAQRKTLQARGEPFRIETVRPPVMKTAGTEAAAGK